MGECQSACTGQPFEASSEQMRQSVKIEYNGEEFLLPERLSFSQPNTFAKVEKAAREFCEKNHISNFYCPLMARIIAYRHDGLFQAVWNQLPSEEREDFLEDLNSFEHDLMDSFYHKFVKNDPQKRRDRSGAPPKMTREGDISEREGQELRAIGQEMLKLGKVAAIFMCAGSSSRFDGADKFLSDLGLSQSSCMLDFAFRRLRRNFGGNGSPLVIVNCNQHNCERIQGYLKTNNYYGLNPSKIRFFNSSCLPVITRHGKYCVDQRLRLVRRPAGTATCAEFLLNPKMQQLFSSEGIEYVYFSGMENLLENPCDPLLLGMVKTERRKIAAKCVGSSFYGEPLPRYYCRDGRTTVELLNCENFQQLQNKQCLEGLPIAVNSMVFSLPSLRETMQDYRSSLFLAEKYHVMAKEEKVYNVQMYQLEQQLCYSFEKDLRDIISCSDDHLLLKVARRKSYVPICSRTRQYAISEAVQHFGRQLEEELKNAQ